MTNPPVRYLGIDISLSSTALVCLNEKSNTPTHVIPNLGYPLSEDATVEEQVKRIKIITDGIVGFINGNPRSRTAIEGYSYGSKGSSILQIAELGGVLRYRILEEQEKQDEKTKRRDDVNLEFNPRLQTSFEKPPPSPLRWQLPQFIPPTSLKLFATGKGNSSKADVAVGAFKKWQFDYPNDDNVIDAYVLAQMVKSSYEMYSLVNENRNELFQYQIDALENCGMISLK